MNAVASRSSGAGMHQTCPGCGSQRLRAWRREGRWRILRCRDCDLGLTFPRPETVELAAFYDDAYYDERAMGAAAADAWLARAREILARVAGDPRRVLDWGAGQGHLVAALRQFGLEADGVEPSAAGRAAAHTLHGLELWPELRRQEYDLVTLMHSLEHVSDPAGALRALVRATVPGGVLFIEVPHAASFEMWRPSLRRQILSLPAHLVHFTPRSLCRLVEAAGLRVEAVHLTNPDWLEWLFALRARAKRRRVAVVTGGPATDNRGAGAMLPTRVAAAGLWATRVLPWIRKTAPGWRFQVLARVPPRATD